MLSVYGKLLHVAQYVCRKCACFSFIFPSFYFIFSIFICGDYFIVWNVQQIAVNREPKKNVVAERKMWMLSRVR